jgi:hypothetical protein
MENHRTGTFFAISESIPVFERAITSFLRSENQARLTDAGLAFLQFRAKFKCDPKSLEELAPQFLLESSQSIFQGQPIRMRVDPEGIVEADRIGAQFKNIRRGRGVIRIYALENTGLDGGGYRQYELKASKGIETTYTSVFRVPPADPKARSLFEEVKP